MSRIYAAAAIGALTVCCVTPASYTSASAIGKGNINVAVEPAVLGVAAPGTNLWAPMGNLSARFGVTERLELGGRMGGTALELLSKYQFTNPANPRLAVSIAPSLGGLALGAGTASVGSFGLQVPLLIGLKTGGGSEFFVGPRLLDWLLLGGLGVGTSAAVNVLNVGTSVGYFARVADFFAIVPEINVLYPLLGGAFARAGGASTGGNRLLGGGVFFQVGLGLVFGRGGGPASPAERGKADESTSEEDNREKQPWGSE